MNNLNEIISLFVDDVLQNGLERFDPADIADGFCGSIIKESALARKSFRFIELFSPILIRKILLIKPKVTPTTFAHICNVVRLLQSQEMSQAESLKGVLMPLIACLPVDGWDHPHQLHGSQIRGLIDSGGKKNTCAHNTARNGIALIKYLESNPELSENQLVSIKNCILGGVDSLILNHNWAFYEDGRSCSVSYYSDSKDSVINTSAEVAILFKLSAKLVDDLALRSTISERATMLINYVVACRDVNSKLWCYDHTRSGTSLLNLPDSHHNAMNISALTYFMQSGEVKQGFIESSITAHLTAFHQALGWLSSHPGSSRLATIAGYTETILMLREFEGLLGSQNTKYSKTIEEMRDALIEKFYAGNGQFFSDRKFGRNICYGSIRWGSGLAIEGLLQ